MRSQAMGAAALNALDGDGVPKTRQDRAGIWHAVASTPCEECRCPYDYSLDEVGLWWDSGDVVSEDCLDPTCDCHVNPKFGIRLSLHLSA